MKNLLTLFFLFAAVFFSGCNDFLERSSKDLIIPKTVEDYKELLQGEAYFKKLFLNSVFVVFRTDDVMYFREEFMIPEESSNLSLYERSYKWDMYVENGYLTDNCYKYLYRQILTANTCLDAIDDMVGDEEQKKVLKGQAHFTRAFGYFLLANFYAESYNEALPEDPCIPLIFSPTPTAQKFEKASMREIWEQIRLDCSEALACLKDSDISGVYEINYKAALVLAVRVSLFMEDYASVLRYGEEFLKSHPYLFDIISLSKEAREEYKFMYPPKNPELVWVFDEGNRMNISRVTATWFYDGQFRLTAGYPGSLISCFTYDLDTEEGDQRIGYWFSYRRYYPGQAYEPKKFSPYDIRKGESYQHAFRSAEVYLSLAEAYAAQENPDMAKSVDYLNRLRENRIQPYTPLTVNDFATPETLLQFVWEERRRELCLEEHHRWWDLRRTGQPQIEHLWKDGKTYTPGEYGYVIGIPGYERNYGE